MSSNREWVGKCVSALSTECGKAKTTIFRTDEYRQIAVPSKSKLRLFEQIEITEARPTCIICKRAESG